MITWGRFFGVLFVLSGLSGASYATDLSPNYAESVQLAIDHAAHPAGWLAPSLLVIPDTTGGAEGLTYDNGNLIVRTATKSSYFKWNYVGQAGYGIYGPPASSATWVTTGNDVTRFLQANPVSGETDTTLLERGLGMDATGTHDAIVEYAVNTQFLMRPTRNPDITRYLPDAYGGNAPFVQPTGMSDEAFANFKAYYDSWLAQAYGGYPFPWTQLGYTFFWGNGNALAQINGMSEFILLGGTPVDIIGIYATQSFRYTGNDGTGFSSAATAAYGNGFAGFRIDGTCDTLWAGHRFQKNISHDDATPNRILIEEGGQIAGGQGLLIWSLNYDVVNRGAIIGATANKYGAAGTANIAVFFKGDTGADFGTPLTNGVNRLTNTGIISSPGTAIRAEAGDTRITNTAGGMIAGGAYAIQTGAGDDTVTINGGEMAGNIDLGAGSDILAVTGLSPARFNFILDKDTPSAPPVNQVETVSIADNTHFAVTITGTDAVKHNDRFVLLEAETLNVDPATLLILGDSTLPMITFGADRSQTALSLVASRDATYYGQRSGNASLGAVLDDLANTAENDDLAEVIGVLDRSGDARNARQLEPTHTAGVVQAGFGTADRFTRAVISRMDEIFMSNFDGSGVRNISEGCGVSAEGVWGQGIGADLHQDTRGGTDGFSATIWGSAIGYDRFMYEHLMLGAGGGYARNSIKSDPVRSRIDVDSYPLHFNGRLASDDWYVDALLLVAFNRYETTRRIVFAGVNRTAKADYSGQQYTGYLEGGYRFETAGLFFTPFTSFQYRCLNLNGYTETGADALNLRVAGQDHDLFQTGLGAKLAFPIQRDGVSLIPEVHAQWLYDLARNWEVTRSQFTGGGTSFMTKGLDPARSAMAVGAKLSLLTKFDLTVSLNYDFEKKTDYYSHSGYIDARYAF